MLTTDFPLSLAVSSSRYQPSGEFIVVPEGNAFGGTLSDASFAVDVRVNRGSF